MKNVILTDVCDFQGGTQPPKNFWRKSNASGYVRMLQIRDFTQPEKDYIEYVKDTNNTKKCNEDDILIGRYGASIGKICTGLAGAYNVALIKTIPNKSLLDKRFLFYILKSLNFQIFIQSIGSRAAQAGFNKEDLSNFQIPLPPIEEQKRIAAILDAADMHRQKTKELVDKYDELAQALFLEMFGNPVTNPKGWENSILSETCNLITDGTHHSPESQTSGVPYVTAKHVKPFYLAFNEKPTYISEQDHKEIYKRCKPEFGDVLFIKDGATTGIACVNTFNTPISLLSSLSLLKPNTSILNNWFLCFWLNHPQIKNRFITEYMSGAAIKRYTLSKIKKFNILIPPILIQNQFAEKIKQIFLLKSQAEQSLQKAEELFQSLLQKAFKGEL